MAQQSGFFDALLSGGEYDRVYSAQDYCEPLATIVNSGVRYSPADDLKVSVYSGMTLAVAIGRAWINGHYYYNDTVYTGLTVGTAPTGTNRRIDRVVLRLNTNVNTRSIVLALKQGTAAATPTAPALTRSGDIYELALADITVNAGATTITNANILDQRENGTVCGWAASVTPAIISLLKQYIWKTDLTETVSSVTFDIPQYDADDVHILEVYTNGILETENVDYTVSGSAIIFATQRTAGNEIKVQLYKSIDGTGLDSVSDEITELQNDVAAIEGDSENVYVCNGTNDNVLLSQIAQTWLSGGTDYSCKTIRVIGTFGASAAAAGSGTTANPYKWLNVGGAYTLNRRIIFDFSACSALNFTIASGTYNYIFTGGNAHIIGATVSASQTGANTTIRIFDSAQGAVIAENCRFYITSYRYGCIAFNGVFKNCRGSIANLVENSYCFQPSETGVLRVDGGEYYAYTGSSTASSAIVGQSSANAVSVLYGVSAPTFARGGFYQTNSLLQWTAGGVLNCTDLISALPMIVVAGISNIRGTISKNKTGII